MHQELLYRLDGNMLIITVPSNVALNKRESVSINTETAISTTSDIATVPGSIIVRVAGCDDLTCIMAHGVRTSIVAFEQNGATSRRFFLTTGAKRPGPQPIS